ncbi:hypothetical protein JTB14_030242 [Gonioctena quinquepunctata]|nr:hypothetical protein JTB14_030242 [Gonioctena quinquepunctata]
MLVVFTKLLRIGKLRIVPKYKKIQNEVICCFHVVIGWKNDSLPDFCSRYRQYYDLGAERFHYLKVSLISRHYCNLWDCPIESINADCALVSAGAICDTFYLDIGYVELSQDMECGYDVTCLQGRTALLPGGRDKDGCPILLLTVPAESTPIDAVPALQYLLSLFSETSRSKGITAIVDARKGPWKVARSCIRQVNAVFSEEELSKLIVLRPDAFWDKQRVENCTSSQKNKEVIFIPRSRLNKFVELPELPNELGGNFIYNHDKWIENRQKVEEFYADCEVAMKELDDFHQFVISSETLRPSQVEDAINTSSDMAESTKMLVYNATETGRELVGNIEYENRTRKLASDDLNLMSTPQDTLDTIQRIDEIVNAVQSKQSQIEEAWIGMKKAFIDTKDLSHLEEKIVKVINWILGHADSLLNSKQKVGYDVTSAEELRREHEAIELECWEAYGAYAELIHRTKNLTNTETPTVQLKNLISQKDFMDFVCRSFALRLERRRNILITSLRFFRLVSEYFDKTADVFDSLVMGGNIADFDAAGQKLKELQESQASLDSMECELRKEGEKLSDMLSMSVKDSLGRELTVDYTEDIINIRDVLDATTARKNIFSDSVELQKLTLKQVTHIDCYEKDTVQAIQWLDDLMQVLLKDYGHVGCTVLEIQRQKDGHQAFQETAKGTYQYGCQLLNASLVLRQSCKLPSDEHANLYQKLRISWERLLNVSQEQMTRLRVSAVFHRSVEDQCNQLRDLREAAATIPLMDSSKKREKLNQFFGLREKLIVEVGRMVRLGRLLRSRLRDPLYYGEQFLSSFATAENEDLEELCDSITNNAIAVEAISEKLAEVTGLAEELDQTLHSAQQDCSVLSSSSSTSTSTSTISDPITSLFLRKTMDDTIGTEKQSKTDDLKSDDEFLTASECTLQHSRSSSYNTASECEHRYSPWWEFGKDDMPKDISKEKMVLAVGLPELPLAKDVLKPSPEVPPGKIVHEVTETTHIKVQQSHTLGVSSFVLTSETVRDKKNEGITTKEEVIRVVTDDGKEVAQAISKNYDEEELESRMKEVGRFDRVAWKNYEKVTKQAIKGFI